MNLNLYRDLFHRIDQFKYKDIYKKGENRKMLIWMVSEILEELGLAKTLNQLREESNGFKN